MVVRPDTPPAVTEERQLVNWVPLMMTVVAVKLLMMLLRLVSRLETVAPVRLVVVSPAALLAHT